MKVLHIYLGPYNEGNGIFTALNNQLTWINSNIGIESHILLNKKQKYVTRDYITFDFQDEQFAENLIRENYDLAIFHGVFFLKYYSISDTLIRLKIPYLIKPHSSFTNASWQKSYFKKKIAFHLLGLKQFIRNSSGIIFVNKEEQSNSFTYNKKIFIERYGFKIAKNQLKINTLHTPPRITFFSRIDFNHKGIDVLIKALCNLKEEQIVFQFWGVGKPKEIQKLKRLIQKYQLNNVSFLGSVFGSEKQIVFDSTDILILTSRYEGFPNVFIETLTNGIPAIVTPGTNACFFEDEGIGWKCELDPMDIAKTIRSSVKEFSANYQSIRQKCYDFAAKNFTIEETIKDTLSIYNLVIKK